ncbi:3'(2'),5'-bisphosphate nucleotidase CysQ [Halomonas sp. GD1P12]|uniref:3'(2'),5'-bisphosphate nucleotidase CysQ n=1 Tax=Halomonas sp. GD1P12 TaxID=2982691 RepID=UPI0021E461C9|nr:3'(2'),5'-bisphosphate nucleotidase CysQ [Halomonas sp. GD1P12]UYF99413.1 3'(2'),5'-bisphosphate nucleotidase CysQ [Halomonas sp. GD1P12]
MQGAQPALDRALLEAIDELAREAGQVILSVYRREIDVTLKADQSPLTEADLRANEVILAGLARLTPQTPVLSEESVERFEGPGVEGTYWLVDPLDGTREFIKRNDEFTVNIALIHQGEPVLGVVVAPALGKRYLAGRGLGAFKVEGEGIWQPIRCAEFDAARGYRVLGSRSHQDPRLKAWLASLGECELTPLGSSLKACLIAEGRADVYPRFGPTSLWDTAAAQAVVEQAGGMIVDEAGEALGYHTPARPLNPSFFVWSQSAREHFNA